MEKVLLESTEGPVGKHCYLRLTKFFLGKGGLKKEPQPIRIEMRYFGYGSYVLFTCLGDLLCL